jgi:hypothetical protein
MILDMQQPTMFEGITCFPDVAFTGLPPKPPPPGPVLGPQIIQLLGFGAGTQGSEIITQQTITPTFADLICPIDGLFPICLFMTSSNTGVQLIEWQCINDTTHAGTLSF